MSFGFGGVSASSTGGLGFGGGSLGGSAVSGGGARSSGDGGNTRSYSDTVADRANAIASQTGVDGISGLMAATGGFGTMAPTGGSGGATISPGGLSYAEAQRLSEMGFGTSEGVNPNNPTQTVDQVLASRTVNNFISRNLPTFASLFGGPVAGAFVSAGMALGEGATLGDVAQRAASGFVANALSSALGFAVPASAVNAAMSGQYGSAALQTAFGAIATETGLPATTIAAIAQGQFGQAAANTALGAITGEVAKTLGVNPAFVGEVLNASGFAKDIGMPIAKVVDSIAPQLSKEVSQLYGSVAGLKGEGIGLDALGGLMGTAAQAGALSSPATGGDGGESGIAAPGVRAQMQANPLTSGFNMSGIAALGLAGAAGKKLSEQKQSEEEAKRQEAMRRASQGVSLFSDDPFARPQAYAGGGMVKKFSNGGFSDEDLRFFDNSDSIFDSLPGVSGLSQDDVNFEQDWADATSGRFTIEDQPTNNYFNYNTAEGRSALSRIADSLGSAAKSLFTKPGTDEIDWSKLAMIAGGLYGYNKADDYDLSGVGYSDTVPQLVAARAQVPYEYDAARRPGSYGRRYLSDMYYAKPEDTAKIQQQALEQAKGIAALQRVDGSMSTSIAPGGIRPLTPAPAPAADPIIPEQPQTPERQWLYQGLGAGSAPDAIAAAYREWSDTMGGDTEANRNEALKYLTGIGISEQNINRAYDQYRGVPLDQYKGLTASSSPQDIARAYNQWIGTTGTVGDTEANRTEAAAYLRNLGLNDAAINQAYDAYLNKQFAKGGIAMLARGGPAREPRYLDGNTNGQSDEIQTSIDGEEPALLSHGEFVVPADVVAALGGGNSNSGADVLYGMMDRVRKQAFGHEKQMKQVDPNKVLPA